MVAVPLTESAVAALCLFSVSISHALSKIVHMRTKRRILACPSCQIQPVVLSGSLVLGGCDRSSKRLLQAASRLGRSRQEVTAEPRLQREKDGRRRRSDAPCQTGRCFRTATFPFCCLLWENCCLRWLCCCHVCQIVQSPNIFVVGWPFQNEEDLLDLVAKPMRTQEEVRWFHPLKVFLSPPLCHVIVQTIRFSRCPSTGTCAACVT